MSLRRIAPAILQAKREVARDTFVLRYEFEIDGELIPGQFAMVHPGGDEEYVLPRPLSILDSADGYLDLLVKIAGRGSRAIVEAEPGEACRIFAPLGRGFDLPTLAEHPLILVAGGVGVVPLHLAARRLVAMGLPPLRSLFGARSAVDLPMPLFEDADAGQWELWVEEGGGGGLRQGLVTAGLEEALVESQNAVVLCCGPTPMMQAVGRLGRAAGSSVWLCLEEQMGCGSGVCRACVVEPKAEKPVAKWTVCREGPVFELGAIRYLPEDRQPSADGTEMLGCSR